MTFINQSQVPQNKLEDFMSVKKFNVFNTNNLWIKLSAVKRIVSEEKLDMEIIVNPVEMENGK